MDFILALRFPRQVVSIQLSFFHPFQFFLSFLNLTLEINNYGRQRENRARVQKSKILPQRKTKSFSSHEQMSLMKLSLER